MKQLLLLWKFSRPHTLIGSFVSVTSLLFVALAGEHPGLELLPKYLLGLGAAVCCNIYITGLNQWSDVEVDRINKPWLPIPSGQLSSKGAMRIILVCLVLALLLAMMLSFFFLALIGSIAILGTIYSLPPFKLKRNHFFAAATITLVRGVLVNIGFYVHYKMILNESVIPDTTILLLTLFVVLFSIGIAWFKDIPDTDGDKKFAFGTLPLLIGRRATFRLGVALLTMAYLIMMYAGFMQLLPNGNYYLVTHVILLLLFIVAALSVKLSDSNSIKKFYLFFWVLFFLEYILYPLGLYV
ncbi:MAG: homogentisate phytyltransferase [Bacteroidetes bacterium]|nr:homogentisate phytyltransferase [Bacteroidota bacterium]